MALPKHGTDAAAAVGGTVQAIAYVGRDGSVDAVLSPANTAVACTRPAHPGAPVVCHFAEGGGSAQCQSMPTGDGGVSALCQFPPHPRCGAPDPATGFSTCEFSAPAKGTGRAG